MKFYSFLVTGFLCCAYAENERATISADDDGNLVLTSGVAGSVLIDGLSLIEEVQDVRTHVSSLKTSVTSRIDLLTSDFDQLASKLTEAVDAVQAVDEKPPVAIYKDENSEGVVECTSSVHGHIRFLEDAQSVEFCHPLNNGKSGWTSFRPPNENSRGWPTTTPKTTTTKTTVTTTTATTTTVTTATTTTVAFVEVEQKFKDWTLDCGDSGPWASTIDDARTINPNTIKKNTWMGSSRAPWNGYGCLEGSGINSFWNGNPTDYWRANGACAPNCPHDPQAFEFGFTKPVVITKIGIRDQATSGGTAHHELLKFEVQAWTFNGAKHVWKTLASFSIGSGVKTREKVVLDTKLSGKTALRSQSWRLYFPSDAVTRADVLHLAELTDFTTEILVE